LYRHGVAKGWNDFFDKLDDNLKLRVISKINLILEFPHKRHLKGKANYFVSEIGQYRLTYKIFEDNKEVRFYFIGKHKDYESWYKKYH